MKVRKSKLKGTLPDVQSTDSLSSTPRLILDTVYLTHESLALGSTSFFPLNYQDGPCDGHWHPSIFEKNVFPPIMSQLLLI